MASENQASSIELRGVNFGELARQVIAVEVAKVLSIPEAALTDLVMAALTERVGSDGKPSNYSDARPYVEVAAKNAIRGAVLKILNERVAAMQSKLADLIESQLKRNAKAIAVVMSDEFVKTAARQTAYDFRLDITLDGKSR